jgi:hypothetical protein
VRRNCPQILLNGFAARLQHSKHNNINAQRIVTNENVNIIVKHISDDNEGLPHCRVIRN